MPALDLWNLASQLKSTDYRWVDLTHTLSCDTPHWFGFEREFPCVCFSKYGYPAHATCSGNTRVEANFKTPRSRPHHRDKGRRRRFPAQRQQSEPPQRQEQLRTSLHARDKRGRRTKTTQCKCDGGNSDISSVHGTTSSTGKTLLLMT